MSPCCFSSPSVNLTLTQCHGGLLPLAHLPRYVSLVFRARHVCPVSRSALWVSGCQHKSTYNYTMVSWCLRLVLELLYQNFLAKKNHKRFFGTVNHQQANQGMLQAERSNNFSTHLAKQWHHMGLHLQSLQKHFTYNLEAHVDLENPSFMDWQRWQVKIFVEVEVEHRTCEHVYCMTVHGWPTQSITIDSFTTFPSFRAPWPVARETAKSAVALTPRPAIGWCSCQSICSTYLSFYLVRLSRASFTKL